MDGRGGGGEAQEVADQKNINILQQFLDGFLQNKYLIIKSTPGVQS
jgi:hypothetical protein